jgi:hypothetical protein
MSTRCVVAWPYGEPAETWCGRRKSKTNSFEDAGHASNAISVQHSGGPSARVCPACAAALAKLFATAAKEPT